MLQSELDAIRISLFSKCLPKFIFNNKMFIKVTELLKENQQDRCFERGVKEATYVKVEQLNRGGCLRHHLSPTYIAVLKTVPVVLKTVLYG